jgi:transcriptional regulator with XRE-family HTH domain
MKKIRLDKKKTGENIRLAIQNRNITYERLAEILNLNSPRVIYEWVNGNKMPCLENLLNLSLLLNINIDDILL